MKEIVLGPQTAGLRRYSTGLWSLDHGERPKPPYTGRGWAIGLRFYQHFGADLFDRLNELQARLGFTPVAEIHEMTKTGAHRWRSEPELLIFARNFNNAQRAANLLFGAIVVLGNDLIALAIGDLIAVPEDADERREYQQFELDSNVGRAATANLTSAAALAARLSTQRDWQHAAIKILASKRLCSVPLMDTDPQRGHWYGVEKDPARYVAFACAIVTAYSAIEEIGLEVRATKEQPSTINGKWNPVVKAELERRLHAGGVDANHGVLWLVRNSPNLIERKRAHPTRDRLSWTRGLVRDRRIPLVDAIARASWLRSSISSHRLNNLATRLTVMDVVNVQQLARRLLLERTGFLP